MEGTVSGIGGGCETPEIVTMSCLCPCVQYGITHAEDQGKSTWIPFTFTYLLHSLGYNILSLVLIGPFVSPDVAVSLAGFTGHIFTGIYAGRARGNIRRKYGIEGTPLNDCLMHSFLWPCAIAQEASIVHRFKYELLKS